MENDYWDPDDPLVDRQPPDEEEFGLDTTEQVDEGWTYAEPGNDAAEWLTDVDSASTDSVDGFTATGPADPPTAAEVFEPRGVPALPKAVLVTATAALGVAAILIAVLRRRG